jgi:hypothetical protein
VADSEFCPDEFLFLAFVFWFANLRDKTLSFAKFANFQSESFVVKTLFRTFVPV